MLIIGLLGGIASGKSLVAGMLRELGAEVLDADRAGHEVLREERIKQEVRHYWGDEVFNSSGEVDRAKLGRVVFTPSPEGTTALRQLESLTHPRIRAKLEDQVAAFRAASVPAVVLDAPVMLKAGWTSFCDRILFVDSKLEDRQRRAIERGWTAGELKRREDAQEPLEQKRAIADAVIDNHGGLDDTREQVVGIWRQWIGITDE